MPTLIIARGLPGAGKSTRARAWVAEDGAGRARVNRDDLRQMLHDGVWAGPDTEIQIIAARDLLIGGLLRRGLDVVCDDTNLPQRTARDLANLAAACAATIEVWDLTDVPVEVCVERDAARGRTVGERVIRDLHRRYLAGKRYPLPLPVPGARLRSPPPRPVLGPMPMPDPIAPADTSVPNRTVFPAPGDS